jgi:penicillin-binding protein 1A
MAMDNTTGDVLAMVGGRDFALSQFNRATQSERQTGSSFKIYDYAAAIEDGAKPSDIVVDGPVSFGGYTPHNYENDYRGAMTLTNAFAESRNIPALRLAARVGIHKVIDLAHRFGVTSFIPAYLPIAIGAVEITLEEQVASYSVFPNDGLRVKPRLIRKVEDADGITLWEEPPTVDEVVSQQTARSMMTLLEAVTQHGTGAAASQLNHPFGGKTGTTSDYTDAWFLGFSPSVTCGVWVGYDNRQSLGDKETGSRAALPIWMNVMRVAINGKDDEKFLSDQRDDFAPKTAKTAPDSSSKPQNSSTPPQPPKLQQGVKAPLPIKTPQPAKSQPSVKPGTTSAAARTSAAPAAVSPIKPIKPIKPLNANGISKPRIAPPPPPSPAPKPPKPPDVARRSAPPAPSAVKPLVKPAMPAQHSAAKSRGAVKSALSTDPNPSKTRDRQ